MGNSSSKRERAAKAKKDAAEKKGTRPKAGAGAAATKAPEAKRASVTKAKAAESKAEKRRSENKASAAQVKESDTKRSSTRKSTSKSKNPVADSGELVAKSVWLKGFLNEGAPGPEHFEIVESTVSPDGAKDGEIAVEVKFMSVDPYLRGRIRSDGAKGDGRQLLRGFVAGVVLHSNSPKWKEGDLFGGNLPFSSYQIVGPKALVWKLTGMLSEEKLSYGVGVLGMTGCTAYAGITGILRPEVEGETIFVSAASGAVGSIAGQIAKNVYKLKTIGSCGGPEKCDFITSKAGYDYAIDYKKATTKEDFVEAIRAFDSKGIDMYFENVGGIHFDAALETLKVGGRIAVCGSISGYNEKEPQLNDIPLSKMIYTQQRIEGFAVLPWLSQQKGSFFKDMSAWLKDGHVKEIQETFYEGVDSWPVAFQSLFVSGNTNKGKVVVRV
mmetsp:Transcript_4331/g.8192  ORF Transcript_4331/g.8192 Transcript_4331/m.8192 type:complete len:440 (+) Transcript_4331:195-1514(+)